MRNRVERLRIWLAGSAIFLIVVIAAFIGYARMLARLHHLKLPASLGVNVVREAGGWTYSQSAGSRTIYTIHAAKWEQHTNGKIALHDVSITLYGRSGDRSDRIYGDEFEYDQNAGVVRAMGLVHMDLQGQTPQGAKPGIQGSDELAGAKVLHVTTSDLVYMNKLGVAATSEYIEFQAGTMKGHATGADYSSDSGMLILHSAVRMSGIANGRAEELRATTASFDNRGQEAFLTHAKYSSQDRTVEADLARLHTRPDGTLARVEAKGNVTMRAQGGTAVSQQADVVLDGAGQPQTVVLGGGVLYTADQPLRQVRGQAEAATIAFDGQKKPQPQHAVFTGGVHMIERTRATEAARERWSVSDLTAEKLETALVPAGANGAQVRDADATAGHLTVVNNGSLANAGGNGTTELSADDLKAHLSASNDPKGMPHVETIAGRGNTVLRQLDPKGVEQTSSADTLDAKFRPVGAAGAGKARSGAITVGKSSMADTLWSAVQQGRVVMTRHAPAKAGKPDDVQHAVAEKAVYNGDRDWVTLTGGVQVKDTGSVLWANQVALDRASGNSQAEGGVKVDYVQDISAKSSGVRPKGAGESTHIVSDRAQMDHAAEVATFYGKPVRLWQGASQVQAPVIEFSKAQKRLVARGDGAGLAQVHTVLMSVTGGPAGSTADKGAVPRCGPPKAAGEASGGAAGAPEVVRIASGGLSYSEILREADFTGGVRADTTDATIRAGQATAYLQQAAGKEQASDATATLPSLAGNLDRVVATGHVDIAKPGFQATGERLAYTTSDRVFLLTGDGKTLPKAVDAQGTTTGAALRFDSCENSVEALGTVPGTPPRRVRTDAQVSNDRKKGKSKQ